MERVTLSDIAREAGVSVPAVAKVISGNRANIRVSPQKTELIREIAAKLNYQPNINAQRLAGRSSKSIGVLVDTRAPSKQFQLIAEIEREASVRGYRCMIGGTHDSVENLYNSYQIMLQYGVDGVICVSHDYPGQNHLLEKYFENAEKLVFIGLPEVSRHPSVFEEIDYGVIQAVRHLQEQSYRKIGMILGSRQDYASHRLRLKGFLSCFPGRENLIYHFDDWRDTVRLKEKLRKAITEFILPGKLDAVIIHNDLIALTLLSELADLNIRVPEDIGVIGCDNDIFAESTRPRLTSIDNNNAALAQKALELLFQLFADNDRPASPARIAIPRQLIVRESSMKGAK